MLEQEVHDDEYLYRGVVKNNWDFLNGRPSSATYKDSLGVSVDRQGERNDNDSVLSLLDKKDFFAVCKVLTRDVRALDALVYYLPKNDNLYHSEIHGSVDDVRLKGKKPNRIREKSIVIFQK